MSFWSGFTRTAAEIHHDNHRYRVELRLFDFGKNLTLLRDEAEIARASSPAKFPIGGDAVIEVATSEYGFSRAVLRHDGSTRELEPATGTWEHTRSRWGERHPVASKIVAVVSGIVVALSLVFLALELLEVFTSAEWARGLLGGWSFTSPIDFPPAALVVCGVIVGVAALERGLRMK